MHKHTQQDLSYIDDDVKPCSDQEHACAVSCDGNDTRQVVTYIDDDVKPCSDQEHACAVIYSCDANDTSPVVRMNRW